MNAQRILIPEPMFLPAVERLRSRHDVVFQPTLVDQPEQLLAEAPLCDAIIVRNRTQVRGALLDALVRCRAVGRLGVGLDNIDMPACRARGLPVFPASGANAASVAEYIVTTAMMMLRAVYQVSDGVIAGHWPRESLTRSREIGGKTLGIVGFGDIGQLTTRMARALGMQVVAWHGRRTPADALFASHEIPALPLDEVLARCDVVSVSLPYSPDTRNLISAAKIALMKPDAVLVNTARGGIVDDAALVAALRAGRLGGAALDVFETEPLPASPVFAGCPNLLLTPHVAGSSREALERVGFMVAEAVLAELG